ncbi:MAG TPA: GAF domain-containing protein [Bacteroidia bacterium]|nr:GAF domain-containing protein [Bacteroidia bacterium]
MSDSIFVKGTTRAEKYASLLPQISALVERENDLIANLSNIIGVIKEGMNFLWVGCYFVKDNELVLGPFQGPVACTRIGFGKGVCGTCWQREETIIVKNVDEFPGHIACSTESKSEITVPVFKNGKVFMVLDVDSIRLNDFDETDKIFFQQIAFMIESFPG